VIPVGGGRRGEMVKEGEYCANTEYTSMQVGKRYLLKLFQEWGEGGIEENDAGGEFKYDIFDIF
jgi:hypothetical protein